ncbi:hypothetical protein ACEPAG_5105 [Sanghuangporus baumii]
MSLASSINGASQTRGIAVYCGSSIGKQKAFEKAAVSVGAAIARSGRPLVYGGGSRGIMGIVSGTALEHGGEVVGVMPYAMYAAGGEREKTSNEIDDSVDIKVDTHAKEKITTVVVNSMHERKVEMARRASGFIGLPGGFGTYEEIFEVTTWTQLGIHNKPVVLLNVLSFFSPIKDLIRNGVREGFIQAANENLITFIDGPPDLSQHEAFDWGEAALNILDSWTNNSVVYAYDWTKTSADDGRVILWPTLFEEYIYSPEDSDANGEEDEEEEGPWTSFSIQLNILLECLNIFGTASGSAAAFQSGPRQPWNRTEDSDNEQGDANNRRGANGRIDSFFSRAGAKGTGMRLSYAGPGYPLVLLLAESSDGPTTTCELVTYEPDDQLSLEIDSHDIMIKCIMKSSWLRDALSEVDPGCDKITFIGNPTGYDSMQRASSSRPLFRIQAVGPFGSAEIDYPNDREVLEAFECDSNVSYSYRFSHIIKTLRALQSSAKTSLRIDREGVLSLQYLSTSPNSKNGTPIDSIVDFWCLSIDESAV